MHELHNVLPFLSRMHNDVLHRGKRGYFGFVLVGSCLPEREREISRERLHTLPFFFLTTNHRCILVMLSWACYASHMCEHLPCCKAPSDALTCCL